MPSPDVIFTMLLNHHGGCNCWLILEYFCDLIAFKNTYHNYSIQELKVLANEIKMNSDFRKWHSITIHVFFRRFSI